ncbi:unnamed protein product [Penicillium manginii]
MARHILHTKILTLLPLAGIVVGILNLPQIIVFTINLLALSVLVDWINRSVNAISVNTGRLTNELLKGTLGNAVELMIGISSVIRGAPHITRSILLGSILCNLLLVLGGSLFFAGYDKNRLRFDRHLTTTLSSLMMVVFIMLATPTALEALSSRHDVSAEEAILTQQATAVNLIALLGIFLFFRLNTHADMFASTPIQHGSSDVQSSHSRTIVQDLQPLAGPWRSLLVLLVASLCALACAFQLVDSVSSIGKTLGTNPSFAALAIIPLVGNITKHRMIVEASRAAQQIERGIRAIINGILRLTMLVAPIIVMVGWALDQPLILKFDEFEATTLLLSIVVMTYLISDGRSNYFEGLMLIGT